jgi:CRISPR-associated protein Csx3
MDTLPAVMIGGPPHSGKSTLAYHLSQELRVREVDHYLLRAAPDGEGDWSYQASTEVVRAIRIKGPFTQRWVNAMCQSLASRLVPMLVDVGGLPQPSQEEIFDHCTHAILLSRDAESRDFWFQLAQRHNLIVIADLRSSLEGTDYVEARHPILLGTISGLDRLGYRPRETFYALVDCVAHLFAYTREELRGLHLSQALTKIVIELDRIAEVLKVDPRAWQPGHLPAVLAHLPAGSPISLYGRGPVWLYAAIACHIYPHDFYQFDPRLGWVITQPLTIAPPARHSPLQAGAFVEGDHTRLEFTLPYHYVDYSELAELATPPVPRDRGLILSGRLPQWLWTALARTYRHIPWVAIYEPRLVNRAVVVHSRVESLSSGTLVLVHP